MSKHWRLADGHWQPLRGATDGQFDGDGDRAMPHPAARLWLAIVHWRIRSLERRCGAHDTGSCPL
ncbi:MAG TPA: hypothetical protein VKF35_16290 [Hyphomicrobiaceae bacterium]|nr:hypothetical protein [Hyphomicrobiaceae bacterium]